MSGDFIVMNASVESVENHFQVLEKLHETSDISTEKKKIFGINPLNHLNIILPCDLEDSGALNRSPSS